MDTHQPPGRRRIDVAETASVAVVLAGLAGSAVLALTDHPHRAVLLIAGLLFLLAGARALWPGRPWFASRWRWLDVAFYAGVGALIWFFSPFTATMGIV